MSIFSLCFMGGFLNWNETRPGYTHNDIILNLIEPFDISLYLFPITYISIFGGLIYHFITPKGYFTSLFALILIILFRCCTLLILPLEAPEGIIPLEDMFLDNTFYCGNVLTKDLFFSGHTSNVLLVAFLCKKGTLIRKLLIFLGLCVGVLVLVQHVHYVIDVIAAVFFAYWTAKIAQKLFDYLESKDLFV